MNKSHQINLIHRRYKTNPLKLQVEGIILLRMLRAKRRIIYLVDLDPVRFVLSIQKELLEPVLETVVSKINFIATIIYIIYLANPYFL